MARNAAIGEGKELGAKRLTLALFDFAWMALLSMAAVLAFPRVALAYVDPSVMTYTIQALAGVAVALSAVIGVAWRRARKRVMNALDIDETAGKVVESVVHRVDPETGHVHQNACDDAVSEKRSRASLGNRELSWGRRFVLALMASFFTVGTVFVIAPLELVAGNAVDLVWGLPVVAPVMAIFSLALAAVVALALSALHGKAFDVAFALVVAFGVACVVEALFLNASLPSADGRELVLSDFPFEVAISAVVWLAILAGAVFVLLRHPKIGRLCASVLCVLLLAAQLVGLGVTIAFSDGQDGSDLIVTEQGLFDVSSKSNVIVFVLDTTDTTQVMKNLRDDPDMALEFAGFTLFQDSAGSLIPTRFGVPYLLTGRMPQPQESFDEYFVNRYANSSFAKDMAQAGYDVGIYSDSLINGKSYMSPYASNIRAIGAGEALGNGSADVLGIVGAMGQCALYRDLPWALKPAFWFYTDWVNSHMVNGAASPEHPENVPYLIDDPAYAEKLRTRGLSVSDQGEAGAFKFIHLLGSHPPYLLDSHGYRSTNGVTDVDEQTRGIFRVVGMYLRQLKDLGLYEDATIIVTADHGVWLNSVEDAWWVSSPVMMVKPAGASTGFIETSKAQTGHVDFQATVLQAMGSEKASDYGVSVWDAPDRGRTRYYCHLTHDMIAKIDYELEEFCIQGDVLDFANWKLDGNRWTLNRPN